MHVCAYLEVSLCPEPVTGDSDPHLKNHTAIGFLSNTGPDFLKNHKSSNPAFNVGPLSGCQRNAIIGPLLGVLGSSLLLSNKKNPQKHYQSWTPLTKLSGSAHSMLHVASQVICSIASIIANHGEIQAH